MKRHVLVSAGVLIMAMTAVAPIRAVEREMRRAEKFSLIHEGVPVIPDAVPSAPGGSFVPFSFNEQTQRLFGRHRSLRDDHEDVGERYVSLGVLYFKTSEIGAPGPIQYVCLAIGVDHTHDENTADTSLGISNIPLPSFSKRAVRIRICCQLFQDLVSSDRSVSGFIPPQVIRSIWGTNADGSTRIHELTNWWSHRIEAETIDGKRVITVNHLYQRSGHFFGRRVQYGETVLTLNDGEIERVSVFRRRPRAVGGGRKVMDTTASNFVRVTDCDGQVIMTAD